MNRILKVNIRDIIYDYQNASDILNKACSRVPHAYVSGCFKFGDDLIFCLEEPGKDMPNLAPPYFIVPMENLSEDGIIGEVNARYINGFSTIFCFEYNDKFWGVFSKQSAERNIVI